ncbi:hypothetical protein AB0O32_00935 [Streptomyces rubiginosohelvolus]|uniref:hypothetical protein n=1 Tax=Streptomyces rubiginosohelvolus TaxID=67362 RepID=UPI00342693A7
MDNSSKDQSDEPAVASRGLGKRWEFGKDVSSWPMLKLAHAVQHRADLESRISLWTAGRPVSTETALTEDRLKFEMRLRVHTPPPTHEWSLILGDLLYCLRSSLDACVWEYAHLDGSQPPKPKMLQFPVVKDRTNWERVRRERLQTVPREIAERIELLQPFNRPSSEVDKDPLICLTELNNLDKHRSSIEVSVDPSGIQQNFTISWEGDEAAQRNTPPSATYRFPDFTDGALVVEVPFLDPVKDLQGGFTMAMQMGVETPIGKQQLSLVVNGLIENIRQVLQFISAGPATPEEIQAMEAAQGGGWIDMELRQDESGRTIHTGPLATPQP